MISKITTEEEQYYPLIHNGKRFKHKIVTTRLWLFKFLPLWKIEEYSMIQKYHDMGFFPTTSRMNGYYMGYYSWEKH